MGILALIDPLTLALIHFLVTVVVTVVAGG